MTPGLEFVSLLCLLPPFSVWVPVCLCARHRSFSQRECSPRRLGRPFASVFTVADISEHVSKNEASVHSSPETDVTSPRDSSPGLKLWRPWVCKASAEGLFLVPAPLPKSQLCPGIPWLLPQPEYRETQEEPVHSNSPSLCHPGSWTEI